MSGPWWTRERALGSAPRMIGGAPELVATGRGEVVRALLARASAYTPDWTVHGDGDAGYALARLFGEMAEPMLARLNRLPEKSFVEFLRGAGVATMAALPARVQLVFTADPASPGAVLVPQGTKVSTEPADGSDGRLVFETERTLQVAPLTIVAAHSTNGGLSTEIDLEAPLAEDGLPWRPFGTRPRPGASLLIGMTGKPGLGANLSLAVEMAGSGSRPLPVQSGGDGSESARPVPMLRSEVLDGGRYVPLATVRDETRALTQSGIIELRLPRQWRAGSPEGIDNAEATAWLRLRLVHGEYAAPPQVRALYLNAVAARAIETVRDEVLDFVPGSERRQARLARAPVAAGSLQLVVIEPALDGDIEIAWVETDTLAGHGATDRVYVLDADRGTIEFGDDYHGKRPPLGFRNVIARQYQVGGGIRGRIAGEAPFTLAQSIPFVRSVTNPSGASGGRDVEPRTRTMRRGPREIRSGGRAVALADYELLALSVPGADVERARAESGRDARFPGASVPGTVSLHLVSSDKGTQPPVPDAGTLEQVAVWLTENVAPAGITVIAAAAAFETVAVRASVIVRVGAQIAEVVEQALAAVQNYLHPLHGGPSGDGWPFGGTIRSETLTRIILQQVAGAQAVPVLELVINGVSRGKCTQWALPDTALAWPEGHEIIPIAQGGAA
jgi:hypothetical protein